MKTSSAKAKGRELQKFCAAVITKIFNLEEGDVVSRPMGSGGCDIMASPKARKHFPFSIECKNTKGSPGVPALDQSRANAIKGTLPAVVWKPSRHGMDKSLIYFNFEEFAQFWEENFGVCRIKSDNEYKPYTQEQSDNLGRQ